MAGDDKDGPSRGGPSGWWVSDASPRRAAATPEPTAKQQAGPAPRRAFDHTEAQADDTALRYEFAEETVPVESGRFQQDREAAADEETVRVARRPNPEPSFARTVGLTIAGTVLPGFGLIAAKRKAIGGVILGIFLAALAGLGIWAAIDAKGLVALAVKPSALKAISVALIVIAVVWVAVVIGTHLNLRSKRITQAQRLIGGLLVTALTFGIAAPMAVGARYSYDQASLVNTVFKSEEKTKSATRPTITTIDEPDPWADKPRVNILLLGGDAGTNRTGTRTDTVILASIDTATGDTVLFSLPRNTGRMPFPADSPLTQYFPYGFTNGDGESADYFLNAMYDHVPNVVPPDVLGVTDNLGADAMKLSVGEALGLKVDYYVLINLKGFKQLVDALGGVTVNINTWVAIGGSTDANRPPEGSLKPGPNQHLNGEHALWFARGRFGADDFARMDRQRCVIDAIIDQANPANVLTRYEAIARAGKDIVRTDMPQEVLPMMVTLSLRVKDGNVRSIVFKHGVSGFFSPNPDFDLMRRRVKSALSEAKVAPKTPAKPKPTTTPKASKSPTPEPSATPTAESEDVASSCAYDKVAAEEALANPPYWAHP